MKSKYLIPFSLLLILFISGCDFFDPFVNKPEMITITFDANGGSGTMENQSIQSNSSTVLKANSFTRGGYVFYGWSSSSGATIEFEDEASYTIGTNDVTLYAVWNEQRIIRFNQTSLEWEDSDFSFPEGTIGIKNNMFGNQLLAWTDSGKAYNFNSDTNSWDEKSFSIPENIKFLDFDSYDSLVIIKEDLTVWILNNDQFEPFLNESVPLNTVDIFLVSGIYTIQNDGSVDYLNEEQEWESYDNVLFPEDTQELIAFNESALVRLSDNKVCFSKSDGEIDSQYAIVPDTTKMTFYYNNELYAVY